MRSGAVPTPLVVGLGAACEVAQQEMEYDHKQISKLAERLIQKIMNSLPDVVMNGDPKQHYPGCINLSFAYVEGESLLMALKDIALSSGFPTPPNVCLRVSASAPMSCQKKSMIGLGTNLLFDLLMSSFLSSFIDFGYQLSIRCECGDISHSEC
ncbi:cysteine desulfurase [Cricetulus griseus]|nr:cysteine desulfurase [Cricetulus griseus]